MPDLTFEIINAEALPFAATPTLAFRLRITSLPREKAILTIALRSQVQLAVTQRHYSPTAQARLLDVFGEQQRWGSTLHNLLWTHVSTVIPQFTGETVVDLPISCTYDFDVVGTKYMSALEDGEIPLLFLFSGTVFYAGEQEHLQVEQIPWSKEASYRLPVECWRKMMEQYYPNTAWLRLRKDVFERLYEYKLKHSLPVWEEVFGQLLQASEKEART